MKRNRFLLTVVLLAFTISSCSEQQALDAQDYRASDHQENSIEMTQAQFDNAEIQISQIEKQMSKFFTTIKSLLNLALHIALISSKFPTSS